MLNYHTFICSFVNVMFTCTSGIYLIVYFSLPTVYSFLDLVKDLFSKPGVKVFLSERLSQDPLENFFGNQPQRGKAHKNPSVQEFCDNTKALRVINSFCVDPVRGNCRGKGSVPVDLSKENVPLPKRKCSSAAKPPVTLSAFPEPEVSCIY